MKRNVCCYSRFWVIFVLRLLCFSTGLAAIDGGWTPIGPPGGDIKAVAYSSSNVDSVYIATDSGIFMSTNGGIKWVLVKGGLPSRYATAIVIDPNKPHFLYAAFKYNGIYKSSNHGVSWTRLSEGLGTQDVNSLAISRMSNLFAATSGGAFIKNNESSSWSPLGLVDQNVFMIVLDPKDQTIMYACGEGGIFKSINSGREWIAMNDGINTGPTGNRNIYSIAMDPQSTNVIYAGGDGFLDTNSIYKTLDGGENWQVLRSDFLIVNSLVIDPDQTNTIYAATILGGILKSVDGGNTWEARNALDGLEPQYQPEVTSLAMNPGNTAILVAGVRRAGVFKCDNSADSWTYSSQGFSGGVCTALAIDPFAPQKIFTSRELEIVRTTDGGMTWKVAQRAQANSIVIDPYDTNVIFGGAGTSFLTGLVLKSADGGASWLVSTATKGEVLSIALDPSESQRVYAGYWRSGQEPGGIVRSLDSGVNWEEISLGNLGVTAVVVDSNSTGLVYACTDNGIYKSNDFGSNWQYVALAGKLVRTIAVHPYNSDILWAGTAQEGIYKSLDRGDSWSVLTGPFSNLTVSTIVFDRLNHNHVFLGTFGGGVYRSEDGGQSWYDFNSSLFNSDIYALIQPPVASNAIYVATGGLGILKYVMNPSSVNESDELGSASGSKSFLLANYPNPFNPATVIRYALPKQGEVKMAVYNLLGMKVRTLVDFFQKAGEHSAVWDAKDDEGDLVSSGIYFYCLEARQMKLQKKMLFLR